MVSCPESHLCLGKKRRARKSSENRQYRFLRTHRRKARWAHLDRRPREIFREHFVVAPFPEENVERVIAEVGVEPIVFGSDFPHAEGLAVPSEYVSTQLGNLSDDRVEAIMSANLARFLAPSS